MAQYLQAILPKVSGTIVVTQPPAAVKLLLWSLSLFTHVFIYTCIPFLTHRDFPTKMMLVNMKTKHQYATLCAPLIPIYNMPVLTPSSFA